MRIEFKVEQLNLRKVQRILSPRLLFPISSNDFGSVLSMIAIFDSKNSFFNSPVETNLSMLPCEIFSTASAIFKYFAASCT